MDQQFLTMLSNLLHLQNQLDPTTTLISDPTTPSTTPSSLLTSTSAAPLLFFTIASVLSYISTKKSPRTKPTSPTSPNHFSVTAFRALSAEPVWRMDPSLRDAQWRSLYGLSYPVFTMIVDKLKPYIALSNLSLPTDYAVAMVLMRLSRGLTAKKVAKRYSLEPYLVSKITNMVTRLLSTKLYPEFIKIPAGRKRLQDNTTAFAEMTALPNICGAIDNTHVRLSSLPQDLANPNIYVNRFGYKSVQLQVVADHRKVFWDVCVKAPGAFDDATHFRDSLLYNRLLSGDIVWEKVVNVKGHPVRPYIVGDWCYPLLSFLLTPFSWNRTGNPAQNSFDEGLMKGRRVVEDAIGLLKGRWRILQDMNVGLNHAPQTIVACCVLHNFCQVAREPEPEMWKEPEESGPVPRVLEAEKSYYYFGENLRQVLADDVYQRLSSR
nr:hypothetical protein [Tanacetum cinerariifolium]